MELQLIAGIDIRQGREDGLAGLALQRGDGQLPVEGGHLDPVLPGLHHATTHGRAAFVADLQQRGDTVIAGIFQPGVLQNTRVIRRLCHTPGAHRNDGEEEDRATQHGREDQDIHPNVPDPRIFCAPSCFIAQQPWNALSPLTRMWIGRARGPQGLRSQMLNCIPVSVQRMIGFNTGSRMRGRKVLHT